VELIPLRAQTIIAPGSSVLGHFLEALKKSGQALRSGDVVAIASKAVAVSEGRIRLLETFKPTPQALRLAKRYSISPQFAQAVSSEADEIYGGVNGALLTLRKGEAVANAGIDQKNAPKGSVVLWPSNPDESARKIRRSLERRYRRRIGVIIVDSRVTPMRLGTVGMALGSSGIETVTDIRGKPDLYRRKARITLHAVADDAASAAHLVMGEGAERVPFVILRNAPVQLSAHGRTPRMTAADCLYMSQVIRKQRR